VSEYVSAAGGSQIGSEAKRREMADNVLVALCDLVHLLYAKRYGKWDVHGQTMEFDHALDTRRALPRILSCASR